MKSVHTHEHDIQNTPPAQRWWVSGCLVTTLALVFIAAALLQRVYDGNLFLLPCSWDAAASVYERQDARSSAADFYWPALTVISGIGLIILIVGPHVIRHLSTPGLGHAMRTLFLVAVLADLGTTLWFFHDGGIDLELHPGIRLFGYAFGRTAGPILGKLLQAIGILVFAGLLGRPGRWLILFVSGLYLLAACHNTIQSLAE